MLGIGRQAGWREITLPVDTKGPGIPEPAPSTRPRFLIERETCFTEDMLTVRVTEYRAVEDHNN